MKISHISKSGVNLRVMLKQNLAKRNRIKRDLPVLIEHAYHNIPCLCLPCISSSA